MGLITSDSAASGDEPMAAINVTSLVDVMFCLLIMFMVATPLMSKDEVEIALPKAQGHEMTPEELEMKMVTVDGTGGVSLSGCFLSMPSRINGGGNWQRTPLSKSRAWHFCRAMRPSPTPRSLTS